MRRLIIAEVVCFSLALVLSGALVVTTLLTGGDGRTVAYPGIFVAAIVSSMAAGLCVMYAMIRAFVRVFILLYPGGVGWRDVWSDVQFHRWVAMAAGSVLATVALMWAAVLVSMFTR